MKKALLIAPSFFGYYVDIAEELDCRGFEVEYMRDRPSEGVLFKSFGRIDYRILQRSIDRYAEVIIERVKRGSYDLVLFVGGMSICLDRRHVERLRSETGASLALYLWDALENCQRVGGYIDLFDTVFSFEPGDCSVRGIKFLPLFYAKDYANVPQVPQGGFEYDACFVGSVHQLSKYENVKCIVDGLEDAGARVFKYYYMPSRSVALLRMATNGAYRDVDLKFEPIRRDEIIKLYSKSRTIIDSPQGGQRGLTMRTLETLGAQRRLITSNEDVKRYDFYRFGNVCVWNGDKALDSAFAASDPAPVPNSIRVDYSVKSWVDKVLKSLE